MRYTPKLGLKLPEGSDPAKISAMSENFEKLDDLGGGVEALKNGTGPGGLFLVSKYYKEPIKDALVCSGGYASVAQYPELYEVLGSKYGMQLGHTKVSSAYGITAANGYPTVYNEKHDFFAAVNIGASAFTLVIYRKNLTPLKVTIKSNSLNTANGTKSYQLYTAGDCVWGQAVLSYDSSTSESTGWFLFNLLSMSVTVPSNLVGDLANGLNTNANRGFKGAVTRDYVCRVVSRTALQLCKISDMASATTATRTTNVTLSGISSSAYFAYAVHNFDDDTPNRLYIAGVPSSGTTMWIYSADIPDDPPSTIACTLKYTITYSGISSTYVGNGFILGGYYIASNVSSSEWHIVYSKLSANGTSSMTLSSASIASTSSVTAATTSGGGQPAAVARLPGGAAAIFLYGAANAAIFDNGTVSLASGVLPGTMSGWLPNSFLPDKICTEAGPVEDISVSTFKLPSISLSESLVYMRTKGT